MIRDWEPLKTPAKLGPATLWKDGKFSLSDGRQFSMEEEIRDFPVDGGKVLNTSNNLLEVLDHNGNILVAKYESNTWLKFIDRRAQQPQAFEAPRSLPAPNDASTWPSLPSYPEGWPLSSCSQWTKDCRYAGQLPTTGVGLKARAQQIVESIRGLRLPDDVTWASNCPPTEDYFRILVMRPHLADTVMLSTITCIQMGEVASAEVESRVVVCPRYSNQSRGSRRSQRLFSLLIWLLAGGLALFVSNLFPTASSQTEIINTACVGGFAWLVFMALERRQRSIDGGMSDDKESKAGVVLLVVSAGVGCMVLNGDNFAQGMRGLSLLFGQREYYVLCFFGLPALPMLLHAFQVGGAPLDVHEMQRPSDAVYVGRHQAIVRCVTGMMVG